ncbi:MAG: hypothetical protein GX199_06540 [Firmicutes bacterium]|nr:hypothetical protein [Bacillota bacterium]
MGNLFSTSRGVGQAANPFADLLPAFLEAIPMLTSILKSGEGSSAGRLSSLLKEMDPQALSALIQRFTGTMPNLQGVLQAKE